MKVSNKPEYLVGIGASAGGLEALQDFFNNMPAVHGLAFVVIQHLSPDFKSLMNQLLSNFTKMNIKIVENKMPLERDTIYLIPPKNNMIVEGGTLYLSEQERGHHLNLPIDIFFKSMAKDYLNKSIAVILSGTGSDGSSGILEVGSVGGLVIAQNPETAQFDGMPRSAISTQVVNKVLDSQKIPAFISDYLKNPIPQKEGEEREEYKKTDDTYGQIFKLILRRHKVDFSDYKETTIYRRIDRRAKTMLISSVDEYARRLFDDEAEIDCLYFDLLIGVTSFFRDKDAYEVIENEFIPKLFEKKDETRQLRVWIAACSTGEEAYSIAILLKEYAEKLKKAFDIKIFASDINKNYLAVGAQGHYTESSLIHVSKERKDRFFMKKEDQYCVVPELRNMIVFAPQNLISDPPFTNVDFISCRNFLIYVKPDIQQKVVGSFHFSLNKDGILFLGSSEGIGEFSHDFSEENRLWKIYRKLHDSKVPFQIGTKKSYLNRPFIEYMDQKLTLRNPKFLKQRIYDILLDVYLEDCIVIDQEEEILHTTGRTNSFLTFQPGKVSNNILRLIHPDLRSPMTSGIHRVQVESNEIHYKNLTVLLDEKKLSVDLLFKSLRFKAENISLIVIRFENFYEKSVKEKSPSVYDSDRQSSQLIQDLEFQLQTTKENLQAALEEAETTNEELQSTNEELLASNEELQSTNEELHSVNEELYTVNSEHQKKIAQLEMLEEDIDNLVHSTGIGTIFLDENVCIRKITPAISDSYNILPHDIGRSIETFAHQFQNDDFLRKIREVQKTNQSQFLDSTDSTGKSVLIKVLPYVGQKNKKGIVLTFTDKSLLKSAEYRLTVKAKKLEDSIKELGEFARFTANDLQLIFEGIDSEVNKFACPTGTLGPCCNIAKIGQLSRVIERYVTSLKELSELRSENLVITEIDMSALVDRVIHEFQAKYPEVIFDKSLTSGMVFCDSKIIESVLNSLVKNGIMYNHSEQKRIKISFVKQNKEAILSIRDNGIGIEEEKFPLIFKLFSPVRQQETVFSRGHGNALGLAKRALDLHRGKIWFESEVGVGTIFYISIPNSNS